MRSVSVLSLCSVGQLLLQFAFQLLLAKYFGAQAEMDTFRAALGFPTVVSTVLVGSLGYALVPVFLETRKNFGEETAWSMAGNVAIVLILTCIAIAAVSMWAARPLMTALQPGFSASKVDRTVRLFHILTWLILTNSLTSFLRAVYHCHGKFAVTGIAPIVGMTATLLYTVLAYRDQGIRAVSIAVLLGSIVGVAIQLPLFVKNVRWQFSFATATRRCLLLMAPLVAGAAYCNLDLLVDWFLASKLHEGSIALLGYALQLKTALVTVSISAFAFVAFPRFAEHVAAADANRLRDEVSSAFRFLVFVIVPILVGLSLFSQPVVRDLLEHGKFDRDATVRVARLLVIYLGVILAASTGEIAARVFYALKDTLTPVLIGACGFTIGVGLKLWLTPEYGLVGIARATSIYYLFNILCMLLLLVRRMGGGIFSGVLLSVCRACAGSSVAALAGYFVIGIGFRYSSLVAAALGFVLYLVFMYLFKDEFARRAFRFVGLGPSPAPDEASSNT